MSSVTEKNLIILIKFNIKFLKILMMPQNSSMRQRTLEQNGSKLQMTQVGVGGGRTEWRALWAETALQRRKVLWLSTPSYPYEWESTSVTSFTSSEDIRDRFRLGF